MLMDMIIMVRTTRMMMSTPSLTIEMTVRMRRPMIVTMMIAMITIYGGR